MNKKKQINIKSLVRALSVSLVMILFFIGIVIMYYRMLYNKERELIIKNGETSAKQTATEFDEYLATSFDAMKITAYTIEGMLEEGKNSDEMLEYLAGQTNAIINTIFENTTGIYGYIDGKYIDGTYWEPPADFDPKSRPWYIKAKESRGEIAIVEPYIDMQTGDIMMSLAKELDDGESVVALDMTLNRVQEITEEAVKSGMSDVEFILDKNDTVIAHSDINEFGKNYGTEEETLGSEIAKMLTSGEEGYFELKFDGSHYIVYYETIRNDWRCVSVKDTSSAFGSLNRILRRTIIVIVLIILALALLLSNNIGRRLANERLSKQISSTADIYISMHEVDFTNDTFVEVINKNQEVAGAIGETRKNAQELIRSIYEKYADDTTRDLIVDFVDFSKIDERLKNSNTITCEFKSGDGKWRKARFIVSGRNTDGKVTNAMYLVEDIDQERAERDKLNDRIMSISNIFNTVHEIDLPTDTFSEIKNGSKYARDLASEGAPNAQETLKYFEKMVCDPSSFEESDRFFDFSTLPARLKDADTVTSEFKNKDESWLRARFIVSKRDETGKPVKLLYLTEFITAEREEREKLTERISSIANIYMSVHEFDIVENTVSMIKLDNQFLDDIGQTPQPHAKEMFYKIAEDLIDPEFYDDCVRFFDFSTLSQRMKGTNSISIEFRDKKNSQWGRGRFIVSKRDENGNISHVLYLTEDITAEKAERDKLIDASERALAASEAKSSFLSNMSHEIRTPINAVLGMNEMILRECDDQNILGYSESIRTAGSTLLGLVNDILDFSKIEAGKMEIIPVDYDLSSVINDLVNMIQTKADAKGLKLEFEISKQVPKQLHGDEVRIKQIVTNILTNAVKYTEKGIVTLCVDYEKTADEEDSILLLVAVKDTGIGIKKEDMKKLFSEFDRIEEKRNRNVEGTGLGMSITKRLLEMMGSALEVESIYGLGSKFSFRLKQTVVKWEELGDYEAAYKAALSSREKYHEKLRAPEAEILVVDDTPMNLVVFTNLLKQTGIRIDTASSGEEGLSLAFDKKYDIIFLDHMMPDKDGIQTLHEMRERENDPNLDTPVICLTANAISGAREKYLAAGFDDYLTKPIDSVKLEEMLIELLPEEKVLIPEDDGSKPAEDESQTITVDAGTDSLIPDFIRQIDEIDPETGIKNCGSEDAYLETIKIYAGMVKDHADETEKLWEAGDIKGATVKIHALKSSSRIIGAAGLGEFAQELENAGNEGDTEKLGAEIGNLLERYRKIGKALSPLVSDDEPDDSDLTPVEADELKEIYTAIGEFISVSDYDSAIDLIGMLKAYRVPEDEKERRNALIKAADEVRYEDITKIITGG